MLHSTYARPAEASWGDWPILSPHARDYVTQALVSRQWAISGILRKDNELFERRFAREFGRYVGVPVAVPTDHGSSALVVALEALNLPAASEVVVPALTWVATASAVFRAGHIPVVCDVDPYTGNMDPRSLEEAVTDKTGAIIVVHWAATMADVDAVLEVGRKRGVPVIEDASQAHGAEWNGQRAGTFGVFGCFSLQQAKVLAGGEGGVIVARDARWGTTLEELRADSRSWRSATAQADQALALQESVGIMGSNFCMSDLSAALLCAQLEMLDAQHDLRNHNFSKLYEALAGVEGIRLPPVVKQQNRLSIYELPISFLGATIEDSERRASKMQDMLGIKVYQPRHPLIGSDLLQPWTKTALQPLTDRFLARHKDVEYVNADKIAAESIVLHHSALLANEDELQCLIDAIVVAR